MHGGAPRSPARAEVVGSLLRPPALRSAVEGFYAPGHSAVLDEERARDRSALTALENGAIREAVERQIECGLDVVTDGEFRRWMFLNSFYDAVEGFRTDNVVTFRNDDGRTVELGVHEIVDRLRPVDSPAAGEAAFMTSITRHPFKVTLPAASIFGHPFTFKRGLTDQAYVDLAEFVAHAIEIERALVADAIAAGAGYIQFDFPLYPYLVDPAWVARFREIRQPSSKPRSPPTPLSWTICLTTSRRRCTSVAGTTAPRGCARARWNRLPRRCSEVCHTTRSWWNGTIWDATAGSSPSASYAASRRW
jgi:hypothetical protein